MKPIVASAYQKAFYYGGECLAAEAKKHANTHDANLRAFCNAWKAGNKRRLRACMNRILNSYSSIFTCVICSLNKDTSLEEVREIAKSLNPYKDCGARVRVTLDPKTSGVGSRIINSFGIKHRALHRLCTDILGVRFKPHPSDYLQKGAGADRAADHIVELIEEDQCTYFVLFDIRDLFGSVQHDGVREMLGLPNAVIDNCILLGSQVPLLLPKGKSLSSHFDGAVWRGLPQGSRASGFVASMLLGSVLEDIAPGHRVVIHGDDIALAARSKKEAEALMKALKLALESHPAGPFRLKRCEIKHVNDGFDFLKYHIKRKPEFFGGGVHLRPANHCYRRLGPRISERIERAISKGSSWVLAVFRYRTFWIRSFSRWKPHPLSLQLLNFTFLEAMLGRLSMQDAKPSIVKNEKE